MGPAHPGAGRRRPARGGARRLRRGPAGDRRRARRRPRAGAAAVSTRRCSPPTWPRSASRRPGRHSRRRRGGPDWGHRPAPPPAAVTGRAGATGPTGRRGSRRRGPPHLARGARPPSCPPTSADFTGRALHLERLCGLVTGGPAERQPAAVTVAVVAGAPGLGKTTLAIHAAHALRPDFPDGQLYVSLLGGRRAAGPRGRGAGQVPQGPRGGRVPGAGGRRGARRPVPHPPGRTADADRAGRRQGRGAGPAAAAWHRLLRRDHHLPAPASPTWPAAG